MSPNEQDLRVRRTRRLLHQAMIRLVSEQGYDGVSVRAIAERSMINRATFYAHYTDKYDLLLDIVGETFRPVRENRLLTGDWRPGEPAPAWLEQFLQALDCDAAFYRGLLGVGGSDRLRADLHTYFAGLMKQRIRLAGARAETAPVPLEVVVTIAASAALGSLTWWLEQDPRDDPSRAARWYLETLSQGVFAALGLPSPG